MTELKIISRQPSIQTIEIKADSPNKALSQFDINRLFTNECLPKFQLLDIKMHNNLCKRDKYQFFVNILERWNRAAEESSHFRTNTRTELLMVEFIYSSLKRLCIMNQSQVDQQLNILYKWFHSQSKIHTGFTKTTMPKVKQENQYYMVTKTFKTNPTIQIDEYRRHKVFLKSNKKQQPSKLIQTVNKNCQKYKGTNYNKKIVGNNFLTEVQSRTKENQYMQGFEYDRKQRNQKTNCLLLKRQSDKKRHEELQRYLEKQEIQMQQWCYKLKKGRLISQSVKNYFNQNFNTSIRATRSSQGVREEAAQKLKAGRYKSRLHTSSQKRTLSLNPDQNKRKSLAIPEVCEISNLGLLVNPLEVKMKIKKKKSKK